MKALRISLLLVFAIVLSACMQTFSAIYANADQRTKTSSDEYLLFGNEDTIVNSGTYGEKLTWVYDNGTLTISGEGDMTDYEPDDDRIPPWSLDQFEITDIVIGDSVTSIGDYAFSDCEDLTSVLIPNAVTKIGSCAFNNCNSLEKITFNNSVTSIGESAFSDCSNLTSIELPDSLISIDTFAFSDCTNLANISIGDSVKIINSSVFEGAKFYDDESNWIEGVLYLGNYLLDATKLTAESYSIKEGTVCIADLAFFGCSNLTDIAIPESVVSIGGLSFCNCESLTEISIGNSVKYLGYSPFRDTGYYSEEKNWSGSGLYLNNYLIDAKSTLYGNFDVKDGTTCISGYAFQDCDGITSITIPDSVTRIEDRTIGYDYNDIPDFAKINGFVIYGNAGSEAENYAEKNGLTFISHQLKLKPETKCVIEGNVFKGLSERISANDVSKLFPNQVIVIKDNNGNILPTNGFVGTGSVISHIKDDNAIDNVTVVLKGDTDGSGDIAETDYLQIKMTFTAQFQFNDTYYMAADVDNNGILTATDYIRIKLHFLNINSLYE